MSDTIVISPGATSSVSHDLSYLSRFPDEEDSQVVKATKKKKNEQQVQRRQSRAKYQRHHLYHILKTPKTATSDEIKTAYRRSVLEYHPDKNPEAVNQEELNQKFQEAVEAYNILSDPKKRKIYDRYGIEAVKLYENTNCPKLLLWLSHTRAGRILFMCTCCFFCFGCCCNFCCDHCCSHCCRGDNSTNPQPYENEHDDNSTTKSFPMSGSKNF